MKKKKKNLKVPRRFRKRLIEKRRLKQSINDSQEKLLQRARERAGDDKVEFEFSPTNKEKMSDVIMAFAEPLFDTATTFEEQKKAISIAIVIWNISLLPKENQLQYLKEIGGMFSHSIEGDDLSKESKEIFNYFLNRKRYYFNDIERFIQDFEIIETPKGLHLNVASIALNSK